MSTVMKLAGIVAAIAVTIGILYGSYWLAKTLSYQWWYEDMVRQTVQEMVKPEALK